jgi:hypothetical protein
LDEFFLVRATAAFVIPLIWLAGGKIMSLALAAVETGFCDCPFKFTPLVYGPLDWDKGLLVLRLEPY